MAMIRCSKGHFYNDQEHTLCPWCGDSAAAESPAGAAKEEDPSHTMKWGGVPPEPAGRSCAAETDDGHTIALIRRKMGVDPVVGWLVCVEGIDKGRDYRLHSEKNRIGRSVNMDISVKDPAISRENHAVVAYDPRKGTFDIRPGEVRGMVYVNGEEVANSFVLSPYDKIELGESEFLFIPFVGVNFDWAGEKRL
jgi:hypothetical protein